MDYPDDRTGYRSCRATDLKTEGYDEKRCKTMFYLTF